MSEATDTYTVSFKTGVGYDAALLVVRGDSAEELNNNIQALTAEFEGPDGGSVVATVVDVQGAILAAANVNAGLGAQATSEVASAQGATPAQGSAEVKTCAHGVRVQKSGTGSKGPWVGWFCALPKGTPGACQVVWG